MGALRKTRERIGAGRRWVESIAIQLIKWVAGLLAVVAGGAIVVIVAGILVWLTARMLRYPTPQWLAVNPQELIAIGVFVFCAAFALKNRA